MQPVWASTDSLQPELGELSFTFILAQSVTSGARTFYLWPWIYGVVYTDAEPFCEGRRRDCRELPAILCEFADCTRPISTCVSENSLTTLRTFCVTVGWEGFIFTRISVDTETIFIWFTVQLVMVCYGNRNLDGLWTLTALAMTSTVFVYIHSRGFNCMF